MTLIFRFCFFAWVAFATLAFGTSAAAAQSAAPAPEPAALTEQDEEEEPPLSQAELEQLVAPIALYPDDLLSQIMMASTYPLEVIEAARWVKANPDIKGQALETAMQQQPWDSSVKALTPFPEVLDMMNDQLSWMQQLGDAFLAQQEDMLSAVQALRAKADAEGNLKTTKEQTVKKETVTAPSGGVENVYVIRPTNPEVVYVPAYDPLVVYGPWAYPAYQPYYWYPPGYRRGHRGLWFAAGVAFGYALWGDVDWRRRNVYINVNRYNRYHSVKINNNKWVHKPKHRKGVPYRHKKTAKKYGKGKHHARAKSREKYRGHHHGGKPRPNKPPHKGKKPPKKDVAKVRPVQPLPKDKKPPKGKKPPKKDVAKVKPVQPLPKDKKPPKAKKPDKKKPVAAKPKQPKPAKPKAKKPPKKKVAKAKPKSGKPKAKPKQPAAYKGAGKGKQVKKHSARGKASRKSAKAHGGKKKGGKKKGGKKRG